MQNDLFKKYRENNASLKLKVVGNCYWASNMSMSKVISQ